MYDFSNGSVNNMFFPSFLRGHQLCCQKNITLSKNFQTLLTKLAYESVSTSKLHIQCLARRT